MAFRILESDLEINFSHKSHTWHKCRLSSCVSEPVELAAEDAAYVVDPSLLDGVFQIHPGCNCAGPCEADLEGGADVALPEIVKGIKYACFCFFVGPLAPTLSSYPHLKLVLPNPANESVDVESFLTQLLPIASLISALQRKDHAAFQQALSGVFARELKLHPLIREYIFTCPSIRKSSGRQGAALRVQLLFLLSLPLPSVSDRTASTPVGGWPQKPSECDVSGDMEHRISLFHRACCNYKALLCLCPGLWCLLPNPFSFPSADSMWQVNLAKAKGALSTISSFLPSPMPIANEDALARVDKRLKVFMGYLRKHTVSILKEPESVSQFLNPCDSAISKREWEFNLLTVRQRLSSLAGADKDDFADISGGGEAFRAGALPPDVTAVSPLTGELLLAFSVPFELEDDHEFVDLVRQRAVEQFELPYFAFEVLIDGEIAREEDTWVELGRPPVVQLVKKPKVSEWTDDLFQAVEAGDLPAVEHWLKMGQDPNSTLIDSVLCAAIRQHHFQVARLLIKAQANVDYVPPMRMGPLHMAVAEDAEACATLLLRHGANPNLRARTVVANTPLHLAAVYGDVVFADILLSHGADPLKRDAYESTALSLATPGPVVSLLLDKCYGRVDCVNLLERHACDIMGFVSNVCFWNTCRQLNAYKPFFDLEGGSDGVLVSAHGSESARPVKIQKLLSAHETLAAVAAHNRSVAAERARAKKSGAVLDGHTSKVNIQGLIALSHHGVEELLPPLLRDGYLTRSIIPQKPSSWPCSPPRTVDHLKFLNPNEADGRLIFQERGHAYFWDGRKVGRSVTQLIHAYCQEFDPQAAIVGMRRSSNWPRPRYLKQDLPYATWAELHQLPYAKPLLGLLAQSPRNDVKVCEAVKVLVAEHPEDHDALLSVTLNDAEIRQQWSQSAILGASLGTWMHASFENMLNGGLNCSCGSCAASACRSAGKFIARNGLCTQRKRIWLGPLIALWLRRMER